MTDEEWRALMRAALELADEGISYTDKYFRDKWKLVPERNRIADAAGLPRREAGCWPS